ncbi:hypothetical protein NA57DRAFT_70606 [Rhizodiscina lignyota]|uniref:Uncharacterized protein n=1 Tax=Rhizodiscina lignyota TaxID=1504668 RepID=A0A9P4INK4_9PEZI|nr:hypothetical protein NA57DRAFT_70606 [Rhizodiscina lignyota]
MSDSYIPASTVEPSSPHRYRIFVVPFVTPIVSNLGRHWRLSQGHLDRHQAARAYKWGIWLERWPYSRNGYLFKLDGVYFKAFFRQAEPNRVLRILYEHGALPLDIEVVRVQLMERAIGMALIGQLELKEIPDQCFTALANILRKGPKRGESPYEQDDVSWLQEVLGEFQKMGWLSMDQTNCYTCLQVIDSIRYKADREWLLKYLSIGWQYSPGNIFDSNIPVWKPTTVEIALEPEVIEALKTQGVSF